MLVAPATRYISPHPILTERLSESESLFSGMSGPVTLTVSMRSSSLVCHPHGQPLPKDHGHVDVTYLTAPVSAFNQVLSEDPMVNRIADSLLLFRSVCSNKLLRKVSIVLFLNKVRKVCFVSTFR